MNTARELRSAIWYNVRVGIVRNRPLYLLVVMTFALSVLFAHSARQSADISLALSWTDYALYTLQGTPIPVPGAQKVSFPINWIFPQLVLALLVASSTSIDIGGYGVQVLHRVRSRASWWSGMWAWTALSVLSFYAIAAVSWLVACLTLSGGRLAPQEEVQATIGGLNIEGLSGGAIAGALVLPVVISLAMSTVQMTLSFLFRPLIGILIVVGYLLASAVVHSPALFAGASMVARNALFTPEGATTSTTLAVSLVVCVVAAVGGGMVFNRKDLLS